MSDKVPMPAPGNPETKGAPDGVADAPGSGGAGEVHGRTPGGESGGGGYDNPHEGKDGSNSGFFGHGGQTDIDYHGSGQAGDAASSAPNATTGSTGLNDGEKAPAPDAERTPRTVEADGRSFEVVETSGTAEAEATGKIGTDSGEDQPGSG